MWSVCNRCSDSSICFAAVFLSRPSILVIRNALLPIAVAQRLAHAHFAFAAVVIPAVVQKIDPVIDRRANDLDAFLLILLRADVIPA